MRIENQTPFESIALPMPGRAGRAVLAVIVKATFAFAMDRTALAAEQVPIAYGDAHFDEKEGGGIRYEADLVPFKPKTDVVLCAQAHAPDNRPATQVEVEFKLGPLAKRLTVFGKRLWNHAGVLSRRYVITEAQPFVTQPIRYCDAFGGIDATTGEYCPGNLSGKGFFSPKTKANLAGQPLPLIEDPRHLIKSPKDHPQPAGFGFYHRAWQPRAALAGTRDNAWRIQRNPKPPEDFNFHFYNGAHPDLQVKGYLKGDEPVELIHLTPQGRTRFTLPGLQPVCRLRRSATPKEEQVIMNLDTVFIEPELHRFCLVWRGNAALAQLSEAGIEQVALGLETLKAD